jgi:long-chain acyl-CoA synthetase
VISFFGVLKAAGTVVNYSPLDAAKVLEHKIEDSRTDILITLDMASLYPQMAAMLGKTRLKKLVVGSLAEVTADPDAVISEMKAARQLGEVAWDDRHVSFDHLMHNDGAFEAYPSPIRPRPLPYSSIPAARRGCPRVRCSRTPI